MSRSRETELSAYEHLFELNRGFDEVGRALRALSDNRLFDAAELKRCRELVLEGRAVVNSYLAQVLAEAGADQAGRLFRRRIHRERKEAVGR
jgi:hypothetical protein